MQDYAIDYVNSIRATDRTPEALAVAMLTLGKTPELRASMGVTARQDVLDHYSTNTVFRDNAAIFRWCMLSLSMRRYMLMFNTMPIPMPHFPKHLLAFVCISGLTLCV